MREFLSSKRGVQELLERALQIQTQHMKTGDPAGPQFPFVVDRAHLNKCIAHGGPHFRWWLTRDLGLELERTTDTRYRAAIYVSGQTCAAHTTVNRTLHEVISDVESVIARAARRVLS